MGKTSHLRNGSNQRNGPLDSADASAGKMQERL
jgi:hypothetical protein